MADLQSGTVTFLLTDIEGSTRLLKQLRARYGEVLAEHREIVRAAFQENGGHEIDSQGDAFFGCFARAKHAVAAAAAIQRGLAAHEWPEGGAVRVCVGIHTGEAEVSDGRYHGVAVHRAARIMAAAHGGQVLLSQTTRDLLEDQEEEAEGLSLRDLGEHRLKDLDRPVRLYQLVIDGVPDEFPPPRTEADLGAAEGALAPLPFYRRRTILVGALAGVIAAAIAIPIFALGGGSGTGEASAALVADSVAKIDPTTGKVLKVISVGTNPGPVTAAAGSVWVANLDDKTVSQIDARSGKRIVSISTATDAGPPTDIAAGFGTLWVAYANDGRVDRIDPRSQSITDTFRVPEEPGLRNGAGSRVLTIAHGSVWLGNLDANVLRIDPKNDKTHPIRIGGGHLPALAVAPDGTLWEETENDGTVRHLLPGTGAQLGTPVPISGFVTAIVATRNAIWAIDAASDQAVEIDPERQKQKASIQVGSDPTAAAAAGRFLWVVNSGSGTLSRIDERYPAKIRTVHLGNRPSGIVYANGYLWVSLSKPLPLSRAKRPPNDTLRVPLGYSEPGPSDYDPAALDNESGEGLAPWWIAYATCAKLLNYPDKPGRAGLKLRPEVAQSMPALTDGNKTYTFTIRNGFRFSPPYDTPVTAETFRYSIERTLAPSMHSYARLAGILDDVVGAEAYEDHKAEHISGIRATGDKLTIRIVRPAPDFLARISMPQFCAVPTGFPKELGKPTMPSAGPYYVARESRDGIILKENRNYRGRRPHHFHEIDFVTSNVDSATVLAGQADLTTGLMTEEGPQLIKRFGAHSPAARRGRQQLFIYPTSFVRMLSLNTSRPFFHSAAMRLAVRYAISPGDFPPNPANKPYAPAVDHYLPIGFPGWKDAAAVPPKANVETARRLAAGHSGRPVFYFPEENPPFTAVVEKDLGAIGIEVTPAPFAASVAISKTQKPGEPFDIGVADWYPDYPDPADVLNVLMSGSEIHKRLNTNTAYFNDPAVNRKLAAAAKLTGGARLRAYGRLDLELAQHESPYIALVDFKKPVLFSARIGCQIWSPVPHYELDLAALCLRK